MLGLMLEQNREPKYVFVGLILCCSQAYNSMREANDALSSKVPGRDFGDFNVVNLSRGQAY
jgi:hypothetical protein